MNQPCGGLPEFLWLFRYQEFDYYSGVKAEDAFIHFPWFLPAVL
jgi:hypothetical protein